MSEVVKGDHLSEEAAILMPDQEITISDPETGDTVVVVVREFRFREALKAQAIAEAMIADVAALCADAEKFTATALNRLLGRHAEVWIQLCALATGWTAERIAALDNADGHVLSMTVWEANSHFFLARILAATGGPDATPLASPTSSTASPPPDTALPRPS